MPTNHPGLTKRSRRCFHRVISGLERGGSIRFLTLTSAPGTGAELQRDWKAIYMRMKRRNLITGYIKVPETSPSGMRHLHILFRGSYIAQVLLSQWWEQIHHSPVVDIRSWRPYKGKKKTANYMAKYMSKEGAERYSWSWGWVWKGFCRDWARWKKYWSTWYEKEGVTTFSNCLTGWKFWLVGVISIDRPGLYALAPPELVIQYQEAKGESRTGKRSGQNTLSSGNLLGNW